MKNENKDYYTPNKYRENPEFGEDGVRSDADASCATAVLIVGTLAVTLLLIEIFVSFI